MTFTSHINFFIAAFLIFIFLLNYTNGEGENSGQDESVQVKIPQGLLKGKVLRSREGKEFFGFMGIPFAQPPERFQVLSMISLQIF